MGFVIYRIFFGPLVREPATNVNISLPPGTLPPTNVNINAGVIIRNINGVQEVVLPAIDTVARGGNTLAEDVPAEAVSNAEVTERGIVYYNEFEGKFYTLDKDGKPQTLTDDVYRSAEEITWSPEGSKAILEFPDGSNILYDFDSKKQTTLPKELSDFSFAPSGGEIAFKFLTDRKEHRWLGVSSPDGSQARGIEQLGENAEKVTVDWSPSGQVIATFRESVNAEDNEITFVGLNDENFKGLVVQGRGFQSQWSPAGDRLLYSVYNAQGNYQPELWITDAQGENIGRNNVPLKINTWADKCTFSVNTAIYCAVPQTLPYGAGIVPDLAASTPDIFYKIDLATGTKTVIAYPVDSSGNSRFSAEKLYVGNDGKNLFFTDKQTRKLQKIRLE